MYTKIIAYLLLFALPVITNDIYVTQSGATLTSTLPKTTKQYCW